MEENLLTTKRKVPNNSAKKYETNNLVGLLMFLLLLYLVQLDDVDE